MEEINAVRMQSGYYEGYSKGYNEGFNKAYELFQSQLLTQPPPKIIVTTEDNLEKIKEQFNIK